MTIEQLHLKAMELAEVGFAAKNSGKLRVAKSAFTDALVFEADAAKRAKAERVGEPSESVLCRSAASIAYHAGNMQEAERFVGLGLSGNPPEEIAEELRNLYEDINVGRHLRLNGLRLAADEVQMVIDGDSVGHGYARSRDVLDRVETIKMMAVRSAQRQLGQSYSDKAKPTKDMLVLYEPYMSVARAASYAFTLRFGERERPKQTILGGERAASVVSDLVQNLSDFANGEVDALKSRIKDPGYFRNFWALSKELAPDGKNVKLVGLTVRQDGKEKAASLTLPRSAYVMSSADDLEAKSASKSHTMTIIGRLSAADSDTSKIKIRPKGKTEPYQIQVPQGLGDVVRKYFEEEVRVKMSIEGKKKTLLEVQPSNQG